MLRNLIGLVAATLVVGLTIDAQPAHAGTWMFNRSYYAQTPPSATPAPVDPRLYAGPYFTAPQGEFVRGSWRVSRTMQNVRGRLVDQSYQWESYIQSGAQW